MLLFVAFTAVSVRDSRDDAISSLVRDAGKGVGKSRPATGSARRQLLGSGVTFHVFSANTGSTSKWSVWLGREEPADTSLTGYTEISPAAGISYGSGSTSTNQATFENSYLALRGEPSDVCHGHVEVFGGAPPWATAQNDDNFGVLLTDDAGGSACSLVRIVSNRLSSATHCGAIFMYAAEIDPAAAAGKGVKTYFRHAQTNDIFYTNYVLGTDGYNNKVMPERTTCGALHAYEFITLKEADEIKYAFEWDAAVSKSIHSKITMSLAPNTSPLFVLHGKYNDPYRPIALSCQGCIQPAPPSPPPPPPTPPTPYSDATFHVFSVNTGSTSKWSVWLGREEPDTSLTGYTEIGPAGGISYGSGSTSTNQATFENSYLALRGEPSDVCHGHVEVFGGAPPWATAQNDDNFGVLLTDDAGGSACSLVRIVSNRLSSATHCGAIFMYAAEIDPAAAAGKGVKTYMRHAQTCDFGPLFYALGSDGISTGLKIERTACGASHSYEFITLKEEDEIKYESDWDAAVSKSIHPKITMSLAPNTSPLFVLHGSYNDPHRPITLSCQGCIPPAPIGETGSSCRSRASGRAWGLLIIGLLIAAVVGGVSGIIGCMCCRHQSRTRSHQATPSMLEMQPTPVAMPVATPVAMPVAMPPYGACEKPSPEL